MGGGGRGEKIFWLMSLGGNEGGNKEKFKKCKKE
jgi:hypothetical protein